VSVTHKASMNSQDIFGEEHDDIWPSCMPSSTRRYHSDVKTEVGHTFADVEHMALSSQHKVYPKSASGRRNPVLSKKTGIRLARRSDTGRLRPPKFIVNPPAPFRG
jgi:hypothetical protein